MSARSIATLASLALLATACAGDAAGKVTISGNIVRVGGPSGWKPLPLSAVAAAYRHVDRQGSVSGAPVADALSSARDRGRFTMTLPPGIYYLVVVAAGGSTVISGPRRVDTRIRHPRPITLEVTVP